MVLCFFSWETIAQEGVQKQLKAESLFRRANIVFIGNSITQSYNLERTPPAVTAKLLEEAGFSVNYINCGVSGSTTLDFLPENATLFPECCQGGQLFE